MFSENIKRLRHQIECRQCIHESYFRYFKTICRFNNVDLVKYHLSYNNKFINEGAIQASCHGLLDIIRFLLTNDLQGQINIYDCLIAANHSKCGDVIKYLFTMRRNCNGMSSCLQYASNNGILEIVQFIMANGFKKGKKIALLWACGHAYYPIVKFLLLNGAKMLMTPFTHVLHQVSNLNCDDSLKIIQLLITNKLCDNHYSNALVQSIDNGNFQNSRFLIGLGSTVVTFYNSLLKVICEQGYLSLLQLLLANGMNIELRNDKYLKIACINGHLKIVKFLSYHGANIRCVTQRDLYIIYEAGYKEMFVYLRIRLDALDSWKILQKYVIKNKIPKADWQNNHIEIDKLHDIIKESGLFICRTNNSIYSNYLLKLQLAIQMTKLQSVPMITYTHIDCNNLSAPICYDLTTVSETEQDLIKDKWNNWYHITDLLDERGNWKMNRNPYTNHSWKNSLLLNLEELIFLRKNYVTNKLHEIHELKVSTDIHLNAVRTIMIELDRSTHNDHLSQINQININKLLDFFKKEIVCLEYYRNYITEELSVMKDLSGYELFHKFLVITRTIMTDVNLSTYIGQFLEK